MPSYLPLLSLVFKSRHPAPSIPWILCLMESPLLGATRTIRPWVGVGLQGPEETVLDLRTKGILEHAHHRTLPFRSCLILGMFVWNGYEYHSVPFSSGYQRKSMQEKKELLSDLVNHWNKMISFSILICRGHYITSFDFHWCLTG